tara:strand:- start:241 stop:1899 length:1659 start_codon:yes stop_codon:yes gene_type:complete
MKKYSTGSLTREEHKKQEQIYGVGKEYDYVIIGSGLSALSVGSLLAKSGKRVCILEAHDTPGGYAHTFKRGDFHFCSQVHYIWGCGKGDVIYEFLKKLGLHRKVTFELFDPKGYDHMASPGRPDLKIPYGFDKLSKNVEKIYPGEGEKVFEFSKLLEQLNEEMNGELFLRRNLVQNVMSLLTSPTLVKYKDKSLQEVFDEFGLSKGLQTALSSNAGDFMAPPEELSIIAYAVLMCGYNRGTYYPTKHFRFFVGEIANLIKNQKGCDIFYETQVNKIHTKGNKVVGVGTTNGKKFKAKNYICNMDPQAASKLIGGSKFPSPFKKKLNYKYSPSALMVYLGLKDVNLRKYNLGSYNIWYTPNKDFNQSYKEQVIQNKFDNPWIFISIPTAHSSRPGIAPEGGHILELATWIGYDYFKNLQEKSYLDYAKEKERIAEKMIDLMEKYYMPDLRKHIIVKVVGTALTNKDFCLAPKGNAYGAHLDSERLYSKRLNSKTPFSNFYWCNATSGIPSVYGTIGTGMHLYMDLTEDDFFDLKKVPSTKIMLERIKSKLRRK